MSISKDQPCIDITALGIGQLPNPLLQNILNHTLEFSTNNPLGLEIKNIQGDGNGLNIPYRMRLKIDPPCEKVNFIILSFAELAWEGFDVNDNVLDSNPSSPAPHNINGFSFTISGGVARVEFKSENEETIKVICCCCV